MVATENGLLKDTQLQVSQPFVKQAVQAVKPIPLPDLGNLSQNPASVQSNTQYAVFGKYVLKTGDLTRQTTSDFVFRYVNVESLLTSAFSFSNQIFRYSFTFNENDTTHLAFEYSNDDADNSRGKATKYVPPNTPNILCSPQLILLASTTTPTFLSFNSNRAFYSGLDNLTFYFAFKCDTDFDTTTQTQPLFELDTSSSSPSIDSLQTLLVGENDILVTYNSLSVQLRLLRLVVNTLVVHVRDAGGLLPRVQVYWNGALACEERLKTTTTIQVLTGVLKFYNNTLTNVRIYECQLLSSSTGAFNPAEFAWFKHLAMSTSLAKFFNPLGNLYVLDSSTLDFTDGYFRFTPSQTPQLVPNSTQAVLLPP
jgi:hypothetical protein